MTTNLRKYVEPIAWTVALLLLFFMDSLPATGSFCVFKLVGFNSCWGCGIGHAIHYALHLDLQRSFQEHIFGIPATIAIIYTIYTSFINQQLNKLTWTNNKC
jgi:hypothetical protein